MLVITLGMTLELCLAYNMLMLVYMTLALMQGNKGNKSALNISTAKQAIYKHYACYNGRPFVT